MLWSPHFKKMPGIMLPTLAVLPSLVDVASFFYSRARFRLKVTSEKSKRNPLQDLPLELVREILIHTLYVPAPSIEDRSTTPLMGDDLGSPFPLSQVCREWRSIIIDHASLWQDIHIYTPSHKHIHRLELWLERSRTKSLDIRITKSPGKPAMEELEATGFIIQMLSKYRERWLSISFDLSMPPVSLVTAFEDVFPFPDQVVGELRNVELSFTYDEESITHADILGRTASLYSYIHEVKGLQRLVWHAPILSPIGFRTQLRYLELGSPIYTHDLAAFLGLCPYLVSLRVKDILMDESAMGKSNRTRIRLPHLTSLVLRFRDPSYVRDTSPLGEILNSICTPKLAHMQLQYILPAPAPLSGPPSDRSIVRTLLQVSQCDLITLNVDLVDAPSDEMRKWVDLPGLHNLQTMCLAGGLVNDGLLEALTWQYETEHDRSGAPVWNRLPKLRHLALATCSAGVDEEVFLRMIGSRLWTPVDPTEHAGKKPDLRVLHVWVRECTPRMAAYEQMITQCEKTTEAEKTLQEERELRIMVV